MTEPPLSVSFFDRERGVHGLARRGLTLLFDGTEPSAAAGPDLEPAGDGLKVRLSERDLELAVEPVAEPAQLSGAVVRVCRVSGRAEGRPIACLGTIAETLEPPRWEDLDAVRSVSALFDEGHAALVAARRPRGVPGHGQELVSAALVAGGDLLSVEDARISTVYDGDGRQRSAGLELWLPGEDFPRRAAGEVLAGTTLELPGLVVNASIFRWRMDGREGAGLYELTVRSEPPAAA